MSSLLLLGVGGPVSAADEDFMIEGRLTTESGVPVSTSNRASQGTLYFTPYNGNRARLYSGSAWVTCTFSELSLALTLTSGKNYDVFLNYNSGTPALALSAAWTNDTTRADAIALQDGAYVKSGSATHLLIGTIRASGSNITEDSLTSRFVWNLYNQMHRIVFQCPGYNDNNTGTTYTTSSTTWVEANGGTGSRIGFVVGLPVEINILGAYYASNGSGFPIGGVAFDSTTNTSVMATGPSSTLPLTTTLQSPFWVTTAGYHYLALLIATTAGTATFVSDNGRYGASSDPRVTYLSGEILG